MTLLESNLKDFFFNIYTYQFSFFKKVDFDYRFFFSLRGALGYNLKKITCVTKSYNCNECLLKFNCPYKYIFETEPGPDTDVLKKYNAIPQPFLFNGFAKKSDGTLNFNLVLVGKAIDYLPFIIYTFDFIGKNEGLGKNKNKFRLSKIYSYTSIKNFIKSKKTLIYQKETLLNNFKLKLGELKEIIQQNAERIKIEFITPVRIKYQEKLVELPEFHILVRALLHRISALMYFHCNIPFNINFNEIIEQSKSIKLINHNLKWTGYTRFSTRQKLKIKLAGFTGSAEYEGEISKFLPLLYAGTFLNLGKQTSFGFGEYKILVS